MAALCHLSKKIIVTCNHALICHHIISLKSCFSILDDCQWTLVWVFAEQDSEALSTTKEAPDTSACSCGGCGGGGGGGA